MTPEEAMYDDNFKQSLYAPRKERHHFASDADYIRYLELKLQACEDAKLDMMEKGEY